MNKLKNSCDGCCAEMPIENGIHINEKALTRWNRNHMSCQAHRYGFGSSNFAIKEPVFKLVKHNQ